MISQVNRQARLNGNDINSSVAAFKNFIMKIIVTRQSLMCMYSRLTQYNLKLSIAANIY